MPEAADPVSRRDFLTAVTAAVGACGMGAAAIPLVQAMNPARDIIDSGQLQVDVGGMKEGELRVVLWRKQPVYILRRTPEMIAATARIDPASLRDPARPDERVKRPDWLVCLGICTHLGCLPTLQSGGIPGVEQPGFYCPCHGGAYDSLGRRLSGPPPENLHLIPYDFTAANQLSLGAKAFAGFSENARKIAELPRT